MIVGVVIEVALINVVESDGEAPEGADVILMQNHVAVRGLHFASGSEQPHGLRGGPWSECSMGRGRGRVAHRVESSVGVAVHQLLLAVPEVFFVLHFRRWLTYSKTRTRASLSSARTASSYLLDSRDFQVLAALDVDA